MNRLILSLVLLGNMPSVLCLQQAAHTFNRVMAIKAILDTTAREEGAGFTLGSFDMNPSYATTTKQGVGLVVGERSLDLCTQWGAKTIIVAPDVARIRYVFNGLRKCGVQLKFIETNGESRFASNPSIAPLYQFFLDDTDHQIAESDLGQYRGTDCFIFHKQQCTGSVVLKPLSFYAIAKVGEKSLPRLEWRRRLVVDTRDPIAIEWDTFMAAHEAQQVKADL